MIGLLIIILIVLSINYTIRSYKELKELREIRNSCLENLERALVQRYDVMEELIEFSSGFIEDENSFVVKLLQAKLVPTSERLFLEKDLVHDLERLINHINDIPQLSSERDFMTLRLKLAKAEKAISEAKGALNERSKGYNDEILSFPKNLIAKVCGFKKVPLYDMEYITR